MSILYYTTILYIIYTILILVKCFVQTVILFYFYVLDCNKVLLVYGLTNLAKMGDDSLDKMDPYQRGSRIMSMYLSVYVEIIL